MYVAWRSPIGAETGRFGTRDVQLQTMADEGRIGGRISVFRRRLGMSTVAVPELRPPAERRGVTA
jgi:hypothetical protein